MSAQGVLQIAGFIAAPRRIRNLEGVSLQKRWGEEAVVQYILCKLRMPEYGKGVGPEEEEHGLLKKKAPRNDK